MILSTADLDGDNYLDILITSKTLESQVLGWYRNQRDGTFSKQRRLPEVYFLPTGSVRGTDLDRDGDTDVLVPGWFGSTEQSESFYAVAWYENLDGAGAFSEPRSIASFEPEVDFFGNEHDVRPVLALSVDIEGDGDADVVAVSEQGDVFLIRQTTSGVFDAAQRIDVWDEFVTEQGPSHIKSLFTTDVDANGVPELVTYASIGASMGWSSGEYDEERGSFPSQQEVPLLTDETSPNHTVDLDGDGDLDQVFFSYELEQVVWLENDGTQLLDQPNLIAGSSASSHFSLSHVADMDGDGDPDIVSSTDYKFITWHENRLTGDANDNGEVDFADFLALSQNFGRQVDAVWEEGDFNLDGSVSFEDFLLLSGNFGSRRTTN